LPLSGVLNNMHAHLKGGDAPSPKESHDDLRAFVTEVVEDLDQERVYHSDLKKLCSWYNQLNGLNLLPFGEAKEESEEVGTEEVDEGAGELAEDVTEDEAVEETNGDAESGAEG